jgi:hypothetical protein
MVMGRSDYHYKHEPILYGFKQTAGHYWNSDRKQLHFGNLIVHNIVLDSFGGSGSTLISCEDTDRICYTMELDEKYADVIVNRYIVHVGSDRGVYLIRDGKKVSYQQVVAESTRSQVSCAD